VAVAVGQVVLQVKLAVRVQVLRALMAQLPFQVQDQDIPVQQDPDNRAIQVVLV
jgi:hypothetical protein